MGNLKQRFRVSTVAHLDAFGPAYLGRVLEELTAHAVEFDAILVRNGYAS